MTAPRSGYPIGALFVVVALCAVLIAGISPLVKSTEDGNIDSRFVVLSLAAGALCGIVVGLILGIFQFRLGLGIVMGTSLGALIGMAAGVMALLSTRQLLTAAAAMTAGSGLVVAVALVMRRAS
jgi:hypothetical protein